MGGHVNVPCTSCIIYCHVAKISGIVCYVTCCYAAEISSVGWGWGGVGWGGMLTCLVLRALYIAMLLRSLGSFTTLHVATLLRSLGLSYYVTCWYAAEISGIVYYVTCCYAAEILGTCVLRDMLVRC